MNTSETITKMKELRLHGMHRMFEELRSSKNAASLSHDELVAHLIDAEWDDRYNRKISRLQAGAGFRYKACIEEIEYAKARNLDKNSILSLGRCDWITKGDNILITGATGTGKSFLACALGHRACMNRYKVRYLNCMKLFSHLKYAKADGSYFKEMTQLQKQDLLILDDFGLKPFDADSRLMLLELLEDRYGNKSTIIASQIPVSVWFDIIGDKTIADAICDRFIHNAEKIELKGDTMRVKKNNSGRNLPPKK
ncbi:IS21-like element helper ATPase IstB [Candidatus Dependentiae bacterium]|nr:IS21-like element helper ATPase IstB [Candidatus Dependentiae bacterium]